MQLKVRGMSRRAMLARHDMCLYTMAHIPWLKLAPKVRYLAFTIFLLTLRLYPCR